MRLVPRKPEIAFMRDKVQPLAPSKDSGEALALRHQILDLVTRYAEIGHKRKSFVPGASRVLVSGRVYGPEEIRSLVDASLDFWLTSGRFNDAFEDRFRNFLGLRFAITCNSGSSANLLAVSSLTSPMIRDPLQPGDEVITCATGFPTTINPIIQNGLVPVFVDVDIPTYNIRSDLIEQAISKRTRAIVIAHTLGNPFDLKTVMDIAKRHKLYVVSFNDPDMLEVGNGTLSESEQRSHFSLWSILSAPLLAGHDLTTMTETTRGILTDPEVIALDQDPIGLQGALVRNEGALQIFAKPLEGCGARAVVLLNRGDAALSTRLSWSEIWLESRQRERPRSVGPPGARAGRRSARGDGSTPRCTRSACGRRGAREARRRSGARRSALDLRFERVWTRGAKHQQR